MHIQSKVLALSITSHLGHCRRRHIWTNERTKPPNAVTIRGAKLVNSAMNHELPVPAISKRFAEVFKPPDPNDSKQIHCKGCSQTSNIRVVRLNLVGLTRKVDFGWSFSNTPLGSTSSGHPPNLHSFSMMIRSASQLLGPSQVGYYIVIGGNHGLVQTRDYCISLICSPNLTRRVTCELW